MIKYFENLAKALLCIRFSELSKEEQKVISSIANAEPVVENVIEIYEDELTFGQSLANKIANIAGSWPFIIIFLLTLFGWMSLNTFILVDSNKAFDALSRYIAKSCSFLSGSPTGTTDYDVAKQTGR